MPGKRFKVLVHVECTQGTGEMTQARDFIHELQALGVDVVLASGSPSHHLTQFKDIRVLLPTISYNREEGQYYISDPEGICGEAGEQYPLHEIGESLHSPQGQVLLDQRAAMVAEAGKGVDAIVSMSGWPFWLGEGLLDKELQTLSKLNALRPKPAVERIITREVLHGDSPMLIGGEAKIIEHLNAQPYRKWMVLGDKNLIPVEASFPQAENINDGQLVYCGYSAERNGNGKAYAETDAHGAQEVLVSAGGGDLRRSTYHILKAAMLTRAHTQLNDAPWHLIVPQRTSSPIEEAWREELKELASTINAQNGDDGVTTGIIVHPPLHKPEYKAILSKQPSPVTICQCGIGTTLDILQYGLKTLSIPVIGEESFFVASAEGGQAPFVQKRIYSQEQEVRAEGLSRAGFVQVMPPALLNPDLHSMDAIVTAMKRAVDDTCAMQVPEAKEMHMDGLKTAAEELLQALKERQRPKDPPSRL